MVSQSIKHKLQSLGMLPHKSFIFFLSVALLVTVLWSLGDSITQHLMYHQRSIADGQVWRIITGHLVHSNGWHLLLNITSLLLIGWLFSQHLDIRLWATVFLLSALMISLTYFWLAPQFQYYVGLSAVLYAIIIIGALFDLKQQPLIAIIILLVVTGRVIWQQFSGGVDELAELIGERVAVESHLFGIIIGYLQGLFLLWWKK